MTAAFIIIACSVLYAIKGGWHGRARRYIARRAGIQFGPDNEPVGMNIAQSILWRAMDGKIISAVGFGFLTCSAAAGAAWLLAVAPSIGEPIGAVGGVKGNWRPEGRKWGWKNGFIRGVFMGAILALALPTGSSALILGCALFPLIYFVGVSIEQLCTGRVKASWHLAEPIMGAVIGICVSTAIRGEF